MDKLELWGGPECTVNRVGDHYRDQFRVSGHLDRPSDLDLFAGLGLGAVRYPVLWEHVAPDSPATCEWGRPDAAMARLRTLGLKPIVGLVHHGSGPGYTNLLADDFATGLARHARAVAARYDWVTDWTPVNEPVTTARFAALYGHWHPHHRDERSFWLALLNQVDATRLAMREVRRVNAKARLIQTDDLGRTYATAAMRDQAGYDNVRRWMGWDLLCGHVTPAHEFWERLRGLGFEARLREIADDPCPPDIIGVNHYLTSDRFLDHRVRRYPGGLRGANGASPFVDTEAVRVLQPPPAGLAGVLREAWARYGIPLAITEVHNGSTREEQMRWIDEAWRTAIQLRGEGVDLRAVTIWALLGSNGWNTLLTGEGRYEPGVYDVSSGAPRATGTAALLRTLGRAGAAHPVLAGDGWWRRPIRLHHPEVSRPAPMRDHLRAPDWTARTARRPILITGATGTLGQALALACRHRDIEHALTARADLDLDDPVSIAAALDTYRPWAVVNAAGWVRVDQAEAEPGACRRANADGAARLADACGERGIATASFSSDLVFDGASGRPYVESDPTSPLGAYGGSKAEAERLIAGLAGAHLVIRTAAFFSPFDPHNFAVQAVRALVEGRRFAAAGDQVMTPTYVPDLCDAVLDLMIDGAEGVWHLTNQEALSWADFARRLAARCALDQDRIEAVPGAALGWVAARPPQSALGTERGACLPPLDHAIDRFAFEMAARGALRLRVDA